MVNNTVTITNVNKEYNSISYNDANGVAGSATLAAPAKIDFARPGKAEIQLKEGMVVFCKSLEPRPERPVVNNNYGGYPKKESTVRAVSTMVPLSDVSLAEASAVYNDLNAQEDKKCGASTLFRRDNGNYDAAFYVTTFVPKNNPAPTPAPVQAPAPANAYGQPADEKIPEQDLGVM